MSYIKITDLTYRYSNKGHRLFKQLNWQLEGLGFFSLFGLSGAGKTTLAHIIEGTITPQHGKIETPPKVLYTSNLERLPGWLTIERHLDQVTPSSNISLLRKLCDAFGIKNVLNKRFHDLSLGQQNRVNFLRYLVQDFNLLIADEALANVDEPTRLKIIGITKELFAKHTILYISHNVMEIIRFSKKIFILPQQSPVISIKCFEGLDGRDVKKHLDEKIAINILKAASHISGAGDIS